MSPFLLSPKMNVKLLFYIAVLTAIWIAGSNSAAYGQTISGNGWQFIESKHAVVYYRSEKDLQRMNRAVDYSIHENGLRLFRSTPKNESLYAHLKAKIDAIFERAQEILDMKSRIKRVVIRIYSDSEQLEDVCYKITGRKCRNRSWYIFNNRTIYANARDINEGILAHEMAHHIIDHYMTVRPPKATAEILARYVDKHLFF